MGGIYVDFSVVNQLNSPALNSNTFANRPSAGQAGRLFISTDTFEIYRDNGTSWDLIGGPGSSTVIGSGTATQVAFWNASQQITGSNNLWFDNTNSFLGIGNNIPAGRLGITGTDIKGIDTSINTVSGTGSTSIGIFAKNTTNASGFAAVFEESTPNTAGSQFPVQIISSLSSGVAANGMNTGMWYSLPDDTGALKTSLHRITSINTAAANYSTRQTLEIWDNNTRKQFFNVDPTGVGINILSPSGLLHADGGANIARMILDADNNVARIFSFRTDNSQRWAFRVDGNETGSNTGANFQLRRYDDTGTFIDASLIVNRATGKKTFNAIENYTSGLAYGNSINYTLNVPAGTTFTSPNSVSPLLASLILNLAGNATIPNGSRSGADFYNAVNFTGAGTLTMSQAGTIRALSNIKAGWAYTGTAIGTITHNSGINILFPDNSGQPLNITNNYALLINRQDANTGTITYTNRWGIYQEGSSDLNYFAANVLIGSNVDTGHKLQVTGNTYLNGNFGFGTTTNVIPFEVSRNANGVASSLAFPLNQITARFTNENGLINRVALQSFGAGNIINFITASGTLNSPTALSSGNTIGIIGATGFDGSAYTTGRASINFVTSENWSNTAQGVSLNFNTTQNGTISNLQRVSIENDGTLLLRQSTNQTNNSVVFNTTVQNALTLASSGNLLIGTTTDGGQKLQVNGNATIATTLELINGTFFVSAGSGTAYSSRLNTAISFPYVDTYLDSFGGTAYEGRLNFRTSSNNGALVTQLTIDHAGNSVFRNTIKTAAPTGGTAQPWKLGTVATVTPTSPNRTIEVEINGTTYYIHAKTTND